MMIWGSYLFIHYNTNAHHNTIPKYQITLISNCITVPVFCAEIIIFKLQHCKPNWVHLDWVYELKFYIGTKIELFVARLKSFIRICQQLLELSAKCDKFSCHRVIKIPSKILRSRSRSGWLPEFDGNFLVKRHVSVTFS